MPKIDDKVINEYRTYRYHTRPELRLKNIEDAVNFVNERGFIFFWPIKNVELPSLWAAAAGNRPVPDDHDDPAHITWEWKDRLLGKGRWYYGRLLRRRNMIISLDCLPYFYALSPNFGDPDHDYLEQYEQGRLTVEAKQIYEALLQNGPLDTLALRRAAHMSGPNNDARFNHALDTLQVELKVLPVGISPVGAWHYAFFYDLIPRQFPELQERSRSIFERQAHRHLLTRYLVSVGASNLRGIHRLFGWHNDEIEKVISELINQGELWMEEMTISNHSDKWIIFKELG